MLIIMATLSSIRIVYTILIVYTTLIHKKNIKIKVGPTGDGFHLPECIDEQSSFSTLGYLKYL